MEGDFRQNCGHDAQRRQQDLIKNKAFSTVRFKSLQQKYGHTIQCEIKL